MAEPTGAAHADRSVRRDHRRDREMTARRSPMVDVLVEWLKWPTDPYRTTPMHRVGEDASGTWLFAPRGAEAAYSALGPMPLPVNFLTLVPRDAGWIATWMWGNPAVDIDVYVDIVGPPRWLSKSQLQVVDLDLDVIRRPSGEVVLDDEDEFIENTSSRRYPADIVRRARATADALLVAVAERRAPFGDESRPWQKAAVARADLRPANPA